jgi:hypothetical protein
VIHSKDFAVCPWCNEETDSTVSHLYADPMPTRAGPWYCDNCGNAYDILVKAPGDVEITKTTVREGRKIETLNLLKLEASNRTVYFVVKGMRFDKAGDTPEDIQGHAEYFYESHSCPTNWLKNCAAIIDDGDADPHGFLEFVRAIDVPEGFDEDAADWLSIFPETAGGPIIDAPASALAISSKPTPANS